MEMVVSVDSVSVKVNAPYVSTDLGMPIITD